MERPGCECVPKKTRHVRVDFVMGVNASSTAQVCSSIDLEEHRGPCRCKCLLKSCHYNKVFDKEACQCRCKDTFAVLKRDCLSATGRETNFWDDETCVCKCIPRMCVEGHYQDRTTCECRPVESTCSAIGVSNRGAAGVVDVNDVEPSTSQQDSLISRLPKYVGLGCVILVALTMILSLYYMFVKRKQEQRIFGARMREHLEDHRSFQGCSLNAGITGMSATNTLDGSTSSQGSMAGSLARSGLRVPGTTAYTITINSQSTSNLDDSMVPLTEDKTRF